MILIPSAEYIQGDLKSEFGQLPPAFLPLGNRPLYRHQIEMLRRSAPDEKIVISLPETFELDTTSDVFLTQSDCDVLRVPEGLTLGESILFTLNASGAYGAKSLRVLHGDTYISSLPSATDMVGIAATSDLYNWHFAGPLTSPEPSVWCGYFAFSNVPAFIRSLTVSSGSFIEAVNDYQKTCKMSSLQVEGWLDLGHLNTYFRAREIFTTERHFNHLKIGGGFVRKSGSPADKIRAEARWFRSIPSHLKVFTPQLLEVDDDVPNYAIEYLPLPPLNELYVHGRLPESFWNQAFSFCEEWLSRAGVSGADAGDLEALRLELLEKKTWGRLGQVARELDLDLDADFWLDGSRMESIRSIALECVSLAHSSPALPGIMHGDFCFSNILFDSRAGKVKVIDPRGVSGPAHLGTGSLSSPLGDLTYDLAKLAHSAVGKYDLIVADRFSIIGNPGDRNFSVEIDSAGSHEFIEQLFISRGILGIKGADWVPVLAIVVLLFLTMIPLHSDMPNRQRAFLANAGRLYRDYVKGAK